MRGSVEIHNVLVPFATRAGDQLGMARFCKFAVVIVLQCAIFATVGPDKARTIIAIIVWEVVGPTNRRLFVIEDGVVPLLLNLVGDAIPSLLLDESITTGLLLLIVEESVEFLQ